MCGRVCPTHSTSASSSSIAHPESFFEGRRPRERVLGHAICMYRHGRQVGFRLPGVSGSAFIRGSRCFRRQHAQNVSVAMSATPIPATMGTTTCAAVFDRPELMAGCNEHRARTRGGCWLTCVACRVRGEDCGRHVKFVLFCERQVRPRWEGDLIQIDVRGKLLRVAVAAVIICPLRPGGRTVSGAGSTCRADIERDVATAHGKYTAIDPRSVSLTMNIGGSWRSLQGIMSAAILGCTSRI